MSVLKQQIARILILPLYLSAWSRVRKNIRDKEFGLAKDRLDWLEVYDENRRIDFHLSYMEIQIHMVDLISALYHADCIFRLFSKSIKKNRNNTSYLMHYFSKLLQSIYVLSASQENSAEIEKKRFEIDVLLDSLWKKHDVSSFSVNDVNGHLKRKYPLI